MIGPKTDLPPRKKPTVLPAVSPKVRALVIARDSDTCQRCGLRNVTSGFYSLQHRRARGMGGSKRDDTNVPSNLVTLCGSATTGCHGEVESHREESVRRGFTVSQAANPLHIPITDWEGRVWFLLLDGTRNELTEVNF